MAFKTGILYILLWCQISNLKLKLTKCKCELQWKKFQHKWTLKQMYSQSSQKIFHGCSIKTTKLPQNQLLVNSKYCLLTIFLYLRLARKCFKSIQGEMPTGKKFHWQLFHNLNFTFIRWATFKINKDSLPHIWSSLFLLFWCFAVHWTVTSWPTILICETFVNAVLLRTRALPHFAPGFATVRSGN